MRDHMGDHPTNEGRPCELRAPGAGGTRVRIQTGSSHARTHAGHVTIVFESTAVFVVKSPSSIICFIHIFLEVFTTTGSIFF